ncbi:MAG: MFS transporter [Lachnospiraceae bacterium]|nr:MFS transporter [Lachnospiraceae bacterium]
MNRIRFKKQNAWMRLIFLLSMLGLSIGDAFNVIYVRRLAEKMVDSSALDLYVSMPITGMSTMMIVGVICSGIIASKTRGFLPYMRIVGIVTAIGMVVRGLAFHYWILFAGFLIDGFGYGCIFIAIRYYAFLFEDMQEQMQALIHVNGGAFAGQCMGTILGGILAGQMHYRTVYLLAVIILLVPILMLYVVKVEQTLHIGSMKNMFAVLKNKHAIRYLVCIVLPIYTCTVFISYSVPLAVDSYGFSATVVSVMMLANYLIAAYASPLMTKLVTKRMSAVIACLLYCVITGAMILIYSLIGGMPVMIVAVILLGLADSFGFSVLLFSYNNTKGKFQYQDNDALVVYILMTRIGMSVAPTLILLYGSTTVLSIVVFAGLAFFMLSGGLRKERHDG